jgi:hypothetical protein
VLPTVRSVYDYSKLLKKTFCYLATAKNFYKIDWKKFSAPENVERYIYQDYQAAGYAGGLALCIAGVDKGSWTSAFSSGFNFGIGFF